MILVTGATGNVGGALLSRLSMDGVAARALVRSPERADTLRGYDVDLAVGSYEDAASLRAALDGVDRVFLLAPPGERLVEQELAVVQAVQETAPAAHVVALAAAGVDGDGGGRLVDAHRQVVAGLRASGLRTTVLAPSSFMQNLLGQASAVQAGSTLPTTTPDAAVAWVDVRDVAAVAAHVLTSDGHDGATYTITGPEAVTGRQAAEALARVLDRPVAAEPVTTSALREQLSGYGVPAWLVEGLVELTEWQLDGHAAALTDEVDKATGSPARSLELFLGEHRAAFG